MMDNPMNEAVQAAEEQGVKKVEAKSIFQKFKKQVLDWTRDARKKLVRKVPNTCPFLLTNNGPDAQKAATEDELQLVDAERVAPEP